jgi:hypothetical protein
VTDRHRPLTLAASLAGMAGFVFSAGPARWWTRSEALVLWGSLASLGAYGVALGIGYLGDPWELSRREQLARHRPPRARRSKLSTRSRRPGAALTTRSWT